MTQSRAELGDGVYQLESQAHQRTGFSLKIPSKEEEQRRTGVPFSRDQSKVDKKAPREEFGGLGSGLRSPKLEQSL